MLHWRNAFFLLNSFLDPINGIGWFNINLDFFSSQSFHLNHSSSPEPQNKVKCGLFLDVIICKSATIFQLFASKNQSLLIRRNAFLVLKYTCSPLVRHIATHWRWLRHIVSFKVPSKPISNQNYPELTRESHLKFIQERKGRPK